MSESLEHCHDGVEVRRLLGNNMEISMVLSKEVLISIDVGDNTHLVEFEDDNMYTVSENRFSGAPKLCRPL